MKHSTKIKKQFSFLLPKSFFALANGKVWLFFMSCLVTNVNAKNDYEIRSTPVIYVASGTTYFNAGSSNASVIYAIDNRSNNLQSSNLSYFNNQIYVAQSVVFCATRLQHVSPTENKNVNDLDDIKAIEKNINRKNISIVKTIQKVQKIGADKQQITPLFPPQHPFSNFFFSRMIAVPASSNVDNKIKNYTHFFPSSIMPQLQHSSKAKSNVMVYNVYCFFIKEYGKRYKFSLPPPFA